MKVAAYVVDLLIGSGVDTVFGQIGGFNADLIDAIAASGQQEFVLNYHEQGAAFAANAFAMVRGTVSVATSSGAPSSCNLVPGVANAFFDSIPCIFLVGSVHTKALRKSPNIRQNAFEEIDMVSMVAGITKYAVRIDDPQDIKYCLEKAIYIAQEGRKGPVLVDLPYDVARSYVDVGSLRSYSPPDAGGFDTIDSSKIARMLESALRPLFLVGGGCRSAVAKDSILALLDRVHVPVVASLCGLDVIPHDHPDFIGFIGHYGNRYANFALANCDCLVILGSRLDERQIAGDKSRFAGAAKVIRVDIDAVELGRTIEEHVSIRSSVENFLEHMLQWEFAGGRYVRWHEVIANWKARYPSHDAKLECVDANGFLHAISDYLPENCIVCVDVGQNQMFTAQSLRLKKGQRLLNTGGYGSMGFSLPAAIGAAYASPGSTIVSINGDGGLQMNIQELQAIKRDRIPVKVIVLNNGCLGMIRRLQERMFDDRTAGSVHGYEAPNYAAIAPAYGLTYVKIDSVSQYPLVRELLNGSVAVLIDVELPQRIMNNPEPGSAIDLQTPLLTEEENRQVRIDCDL
jgi:acetolactate synthase-1/2/3 large subunit